LALNYREGERENRTAAQVLLVPSRPPSLILNQTALWTCQLLSGPVGAVHGEDSRAAGGPVLAARVGAAGHVGDDGAHVGVGPEGPAEGDGRAGGGGGVQLGRDGAGVALDVNRGGVLNGAVAGDRAGDALRLVGGKGCQLTSSCVSMGCSSK